MNKLIIPAIINSYRPRADKSWSVGLVINEPSQNQKQIIDALYQHSVFVLIKDADITPDEESTIDNIDQDINTKTPSQRLRSVLFLMHKNDNEGSPDFKDFYRLKMEKVINHFKSKLDE